MTSLPESVPPGPDARGGKCVFGFRGWVWRWLGKLIAGSVWVETAVTISSWKRASEKQKLCASLIIAADVCTCVCVRVEQMQWSRLHRLDSSKLGSVMCLQSISCYNRLQNCSIECVIACSKACVFVCVFSSERWPHSSPSGSMRSHTVFQSANQPRRQGDKTQYFVFFFTLLGLTFQFNLVWTSALKLTGSTRVFLQNHHIIKIKTWGLVDLQLS